MTRSEKPSKTDRKRYTFNMALVGATSLAGFLTVLILFIALFAGLWLDNQMATTENHIFTIILLCVSVPITLLTMLWVVRWATSRLKPSVQDEAELEEDA